MISSPCKDCPNVHHPKDECSKRCPLIQAIQDFASGNANLISTAIDYSEDVRFSLPTSLCRSHVSA